MIIDITEQTRKNILQYIDNKIRKVESITKIVTGFTLLM